MKKCIIITTINPIEKTLIDKYYGLDYDIIIVGDLKTPHNTYMDKPLIYIHPNDDIYDELNKSLPFNHYCRKNIGYMYAIKNGYDIIFETDDDNYPLENFGYHFSDYKKVIGPKYPNIVKLFTDQHMWLRGYPLHLINKGDIFIFSSIKEDDGHKIGIVQSLANGDPDVDAIFRLSNQNYNDNIKFDENKAFIINKDVYVQGNTQATFWVDKDLFHLLYIPSTVSFRFCDILKMYIAQKCMWAYDKLMCYISPVISQTRNDHNLMEDFKSEYPMYIQTFTIIDDIFDKIQLKGDKEDLFRVYDKLLEHGIIESHEMGLLRLWINLCS